MVSSPLEIQDSQEKKSPKNWIEVFRAIQPGLSVKALAAKLHELGSQEATGRTDGHAKPIKLPALSALRVQLYGTLPSSLEVELTPIFEEALKVLAENPDYLDGMIPVDRANIAQLVDWIRSKVDLTMEDLLVSGFSKNMFSGRQSLCKPTTRKRPPFTSINPKQFNLLKERLQKGIQQALNT